MVIKSKREEIKGAERRILGSKGCQRPMKSTYFITPRSNYDLGFLLKNNVLYSSRLVVLFFESVF